MVEGLPLEFTFNKQLSQVLPVHTNGACTSHLIINRNIRKHDMQLSILTETLNETLKGNEIDPHLIAFPLEQHYFEA